MLNRRILYLKANEACMEMGEVEKKDLCRGSHT